MFASFPLSLLDCFFLSSSAHLWVSLPVLSIPPQAVIANDIDMIAEGKGNDDLLVAYFFYSPDNIYCICTYLNWEEFTGIDYSSSSKHPFKKKKAQTQHLFI